MKILIVIASIVFGLFGIGMITDYIPDNIWSHGSIVVISFILGVYLPRDRFRIEKVLYYSVSVLYSTSSIYFLIKMFN